MKTIPMKIIPFPNKGGWSLLDRDGQEIGRVRDDRAWRNMFVVNTCHDERTETGYVRNINDRWLLIDLTAFLLPPTVVECVALCATHGVPCGGAYVMNPPTFPHKG